MPITAGLTIRDATPQLVAALKALVGRKLMVGVPSDDEQPHRGIGTVSPNERVDSAGVSQPMNNATIGYVHETGAPEVGIPARPHLVPGVNAAKEKLVGRLGNAGKAVLRGDLPAADRYLEAAGLEAVSSVRRTIQAGVPPPLKPATVAARRRRSKGSTYRRKAVAASDTTPLIDSGNYVQSISYVIRRGKP